MEVEFTKLSSKGQVVIPRSIREDLRLREGTPFVVMKQRDTIILKRMELPKIKTWEEAASPFRQAAKKSGFTNEDLDVLIGEVRKSRK